MKRIVKIVPRHGAFVVKHSKEKIIEILLAREALEGMAAGLATHHMNEAAGGFRQDLGPIPPRAG